MFWGLIMEPGKKYSQVVEKDFHIAQAALDLDSAQDSPVQVLISIYGRNYLACTLIKDKVCQANLDLNFRAGVKVSFATNGPGHVHLTGYLIEENEYVMEEDSDDDIEEEESADEIEQESTKKRKAQRKNEKPNKKTKTAMLLDQLDEESYNEEDDSNVNLTDLLEESDDSDDGSEDEAEDEELDGEEASDDDEDDDDDDDESEEEESSDEDVKIKVSPKKEQESPKQNGVTKKTPKNEKVQKIDKTPKSNDKSPKGTPKGAKTPGQDKQKTPGQEKQKTPKANKSPGGGDTGTPNKKTIEGGVIIEDLKVGDGPVAKSGRHVRVYYEGRLKTNNKVFDSATKGPGFKFRLGKQEVIKAWDVGVAGMKIGGKRRITCPPHMAYGAAGSPPVIPPNSTLVFEVELKQIL